MADVAAHAGVSSAVVSYVINRGPRTVAPATAERVNQSIAALGYRPNRSARALQRGSTGLIGLILPETSNPFFGAYADALYRAADRCGVVLVSASSSGDENEERHHIDDMVARDVDAIILSSAVPISDLRTLTPPAARTVLINCPFPVAGFDTVGPASADASTTLVEHLVLTHGHRAIAHIAGDTHLTRGEPREAGWREALRRHGLETGRLVNAPFTGRGGYQATRLLLDGPSRPSAVFASNDQQAIGALYALHEQGLRVPEDVAVVGFDGTDLTALTWPGLTVMKQPLSAMAAAAIEAAGAQPGAGHQSFELELIARGSCGCQRQPVEAGSDR